MPLIRCIHQRYDGHILVEVAIENLFGMWKFVTKTA